MGSTDERGMDMGGAFPPVFSLIAFVTGVSASVFHSPHSGQRPSHFGSSRPHDEHRKMKAFCFFTGLKYSKTHSIDHISKLNQTCIVYISAAVSRIRTQK